MSFHYKSIDTLQQYNDMKSLLFSKYYVAFCSTQCTLWQYGLWSFQTGGTKLERFLPKYQDTQRKLLNFENWTNGEPQ